MVMKIDESEFYTSAEACATLKIRRATLYSYVSRGLVRSYQQGVQRRSLYRCDEIEALLSVRPKIAAPKRIGPYIPMAESWVADV